jgi:hypothetical protein
MANAQRTERQLWSLLSPQRLDALELLTEVAKDVRIGKVRSLVYGDELYCWQQIVHDRRNEVRL